VINTRHASRIRRIRAARDLLAAQTEAATPGPWTYSDGLNESWITDEPTGTMAVVPDPHTGRPFGPDAALIVTLAQPATARAVLAVLDAELALNDVRDLVGVDDTILALADVILAANRVEHEHPRS
jgi:hypothetical protein